MEFFKSSSKGKVVLVASNKPEALVLDRAKKFGVPTFVFTKKEMETGILEERLKQDRVDWVILAGFLLKIPESLIRSFPDSIVNIHPALLPKFGGKGMYGAHVHQAVKDAGDKETGITIHLVNEQYDQGRIIFQAATPVYEEDSPEQIAEKVHDLEHRFFSQVIDSLL
ncbi:phosphoribosylglycinamide formyltransferase [Algoriphagus confluentis]|uniref:phosphoribosylglycinamide formyltransferase 1 n=2 Tax=Algoriphagus confluentis TaxID=1697556 RepID=A0ABQ6PQX4_9BACT|nr:phosphoribosylglycinamide formyltransferase [Algoriphagus confluentis]